MAASSWYRTGTIGPTNGQATIPGNSTGWLAAGIGVGDELSVDNRVSYEVQGITDDQTMTIDRPYEGPTVAAASYSIRRNFSPLAATLMTNVNALLTILRTLSGATPVQFGSGAPSGASLQGVFYVDVLNAKLYAYFNGAWIFAGTGDGSGGGGGGANFVIGSGNPAQLLGQGFIYFDRVSRTFWVEDNGAWVHDTAGGNVISSDGINTLVNRGTNLVSASQFVALANAGQPNFLFGASGRMQFGDSSGTGVFNLDYWNGLTTSSMLKADAKGIYMPQAKELVQVVNPLVGNVVFDLSKFSCIVGTPTSGAPLQIKFTNFTPGYVNRALLIMTNGGTAGTISYGGTGSTVLFEAGSPPSYSLAATDVIAFFSADGVTWFGIPVGKGFA